MNIKSSLLVFFAILTMAILLVLSAFGIMDTIGDAVTISFGFMLSAYCGGSQLAAVLKTKSLPAGERFSGNRKKLSLISISILLLLVEALILETISGKQMPSVYLSACLFSVVGLLVGGEKTKTAMEGKQKNGT